MAGRLTDLAPRDAGPAGQKLANRDVLPQDCDAAESTAHIGTAGERLEYAGRCKGEAAKLRQRLLWLADQLQRAFRRRGRSVQGERRRLRRSAADRKQERVPGRTGRRLTAGGCPAEGPRVRQTVPDPA